MRPVWLLDVDGVINATRAGWGSSPHHGTAHYRGVGYTMRWSAIALQRIRHLHQQCLEVRWCTTWCPEAPQLEALFSLPSLGCALTPEQASGVDVDTHKQRAAHHVLHVEQRPLIWTDDQAIPSDAASFDTPNALLLSPNPSRGLRPEHLDYVEAWVANRQRT